MTSDDYCIVYQLFLWNMIIGWDFILRQKSDSNDKKWVNTDKLIVSTKLSESTDKKTMINRKKMNKTIKKYNEQVFKQFTAKNDSTS